ncbi:ComEC/Rec2 family competence protein [Pseudochryseolinea flava]|uniref:ComEC family competence protein n=1 Tax=Pseudochryseolinea flava TaxID=2059302 RepID=A0A364Y3W6_9BACT|nr:ComEC/Rec2 family competence protein [Pseudochryseolinea flava]RAW01024.1 hypothetical protein DQQ10_12385 [Pseudochryseolinea flava]
MFTWIPYAFVRIVVFFIAGILAGLYWPVSIPPLYAILALLVLIGAYFVFTWRHLRYEKTINPGVFGLVAILFAGFINVQLRDPRIWHSHLSHERDSVEAYVATVRAAPQRKDKTWKVEVSLNKIRTSLGWKKSEGKLLLYLPHTNFAKPPEYGDVLFIEGTPASVPPPANLGEFDYKKFLSYQGIYHQHFIRGKLVVIAHAPPSFFIDQAIKARHWAETNLARYVDGTRERGIAIALVLGVTDGLDRELVGAYGATGTLHVLAVSGLHISIIYMIIAWILTPLNRSTNGKWTVAAISIVILWSYAFITGLSPSVLRAVTMFTFVALAKPWKQTINIYNTLACSAFLLLLFDPQMIMSVGFQLSYLAVLGIVYLHPKLYERFEPSSRVVDEIWKVTAVSIAAQVATLPLGLYYFHQFPNYFIISNLLVIPASFVVLIAGILVLALSWISFVASVLGCLLMWVIKIMNAIVFLIESIPGSVTDDIFFTTFQAILLALLIVSLLCLFERKQFGYAVLSFCIALTLGGSRWVYHFTNIAQQRVSVYNVSKHAAVELVNRGQSLFLTDSVLRDDTKKIDFHITPSRLMFGVYAAKSDSLVTKRVDGGKLFIWCDKYFLWLDHKPQQEIPKLSVDYVLVSNNAMSSLEAIRNVTARRVIVDSSNSFYLAKRLSDEAQKQGVDLVAVSQQGSYHETIDL